MAQSYSISPVAVEDSTVRFATTLTVVGRILLALMFILSGMSKLGDISGTASFIASAGLPLATLVAVAVGVFELVAGLALAVGWYARLAACLLGLFTLVASITFHAYWSAPPEQQFIQQLMFMKNLSVAGGMFFITALGAGRGSVDSLSRR